MTGLEIIEKYPLSIKIIREWYQAKMLEALSDKSISEEFATYMIDQGIPDDLIISTLEDNPRMLFDILDANELYIHIVPISPNKGIMKFLVGIDTLESLDDTPSRQYSTRKEAERFAIEVAFDILEQKLRKDEENN